MSSDRGSKGDSSGRKYHSRRSEIPRLNRSNSNQRRCDSSVSSNRENETVQEVSRERILNSGRQVPSNNYNSSIARRNESSSELFSTVPSSSPTIGSSQFRHFQRSSCGRTNQGLYTLRGFSGNSERGQFVYFDCFTTIPLALQVTTAGIRMAAPNGFGGGNPHQYHYQGSQPGTGQNQRQFLQQESGPASQPSQYNHGNNIFNFYFVNSGEYGLNFSGVGLTGVGGQPASQPQPQQSSSSAVNGNNGIQNIPGTPTRTVVPAANPSVAASTPLLGTETRTTRVPLADMWHAGGSSAFQPYGYAAANNYAHQPNPLHNAFYRYRELDNSMTLNQNTSLSQSHDYEDLFEDEHGYRSSSQCSASKSAPYGGPCRHY